MEDLLARCLASNETNKDYRENQLRFLAWAATRHRGVSFKELALVHMVYFLVDVRQDYRPQASLLNTLRVAVTHPHEHPKCISESTAINHYINSMMKQAPSVSIHPLAIIDISLVLAYARWIASGPSTKIKVLQQKLAFLVITKFLRPFVLAHILFPSCFVLQDPHFHFTVLALKETRGKRRIIKPLTTGPHATADMELCLLQCFKTFRDHPRLVFHPFGCQQHFVKSNDINQALSFSTMLSWLHREFIAALCTSKQGVTIQSLELFPTLDLVGVSMDNVVALAHCWCIPRLHLLYRITSYHYSSSKSVLHKVLSPHNS